MTEHEPPSLGEIGAYREVVKDRVVRTPVHEWRGTAIQQQAPDMRINVKFELLQMTGTFKARGALAWMLSLPREQLERGVTAVSAGNHAIAVAWAAQVLGASAHVVIVSPANPARVQQARAWGAKVELIDNAEAAFNRAMNIEREDGRTLVHPFEGRSIAIGTGALAMEWLEQSPDLDALVIPVGGGGLVAGIAAAAKRIRPGNRCVWSRNRWAPTQCSRALPKISRFMRPDVIRLPTAFELRMHVITALRWPGATWTTWDR